MPSIHFVERKNNVTKAQDYPGEYESGYWVINKETAERLVGGNLYLHSTQDAESHYGGVIQAWRVIESDERPDIKGRIVFRIKPTQAHRGVKAGREGWSQEKKIVW